MKKIPADAFDFYFSLGPSRSYQAVADRYKVTKRAVTDLAKRERWQARLEKVVAEARAKSDQRMAEVIEKERERHLQALRLVLGKGLESLKGMRFTQPMEAARAIGLAVREIRVTLGEPSDRTAVSVEETIKREYERWLMPAAGDPAANEEGGE
ncbi:MAG TPA: hypothetical protein VGQ24_11135 [Gemmatimonadales bacterium]|nr:hypothetical protein [Gemmatimonadales bacterium]